LRGKEAKKKWKTSLKVGGNMSPCKVWGRPISIPDLGKVIGHCSQDSITMCPQRSKMSNSVLDNVMLLII